MDKHSLGGSKDDSKSMLERSAGSVQIKGLSLVI